MTESTREKVDAAERAALDLANVPEDERNDALQSIADALRERTDEILDANETDVAAAEAAHERGEYSAALVDRLRLDESKVEDISGMVESVAGQDDPLGRTLSARELDDGLDLYKVSVPIGVVATVFESRPDALVQIAALALKSGNAVLLKGGSEASESNRVLYDIITEVADDVSPGWAQLIEAREDVDRLLDMDDSVDLVMPRGSSAFVSYIQDNTQIPVLGHTEGICHVFVDDAADLDMAADVAFDAKVQYPAVCNAVETLLVHDSIASEFLPEIVSRYRDADVTLRGDQRTREIVDIDPVTDDDWDSEYGDLELAIKVVEDVYDAVDHVNTHGSKHTESIVTEDDEHAAVFMQGIDAASVFHNASTRFADGYRYGLGAEVGISTGKTHARGPVGLDGLTTYKYYLEGDGHLVAAYSGEDAQPFTHEDFDGEWTP
ncbi:glutamate-5-semialdehyde dehydrogenase [Salarchaeum japonicum]|uniref:glutamate-5-semialdehyde dehydrogenase n=1 Tax=Salarchaeum japonicum TaxID=555573 RepID=UPI003C729E84